MTVETEGFGVTCTDALTQAKLIATDKLIGSFVSGERSIDGANYDEKVTEYSGGVLRRYTVLNTSGESPCTVRISAEVTPDKRNWALNPKVGKVDAGAVLRGLEKQEADKRLLADLIQRPEMFTPVLSDIAVAGQVGNKVKATVRVDRILMSEKWVSDLEAFMELHGRRLDFEKTSPFHLGKWIVEKFGAKTQMPITTAISLYGKPYPDGTTFNEGGDGFICFRADGSGTALRCYMTWLAQDAFTLMRGVQLTYQFANGNRISRVGPSNAIALIAEDRYGTYSNEEAGVIKGLFVVGISGLPVTNVLDLDGKSMFSNSALSTQVEFLVKH